MSGSAATDARGVTDQDLGNTSTGNAAGTETGIVIGRGSVNERKTGWYLFNVSNLMCQLRYISR